MEDNEKYKLCEGETKENKKKKRAILRFLLILYFILMTSLVGKKQKIVSQERDVAHLQFN